MEMHNIFKKKTVIILGILCLFFNPIYSQEPPDLIPQSPNAYSLGKYGDIPVSYHTGTPSISVPLQSISDKDLTVNMSLSYHGSGVKVDEVASWVGLGWSLNAGGVITRVVRGRAEYPLVDGTLNPERASIEFYDPVTDVPSVYVQQNKLPAASTNQLDNEPDIFYFNFEGNSGKFFFDENGNPVFDQYLDMDVQFKYVGPGESKFILTTPSGVVYEFSDTEKTFYGGANDWQVSSWYLSSINSPRGGSIDFQYQSEGTVRNYIRASDSHIVDLNNSNIGIYPNDPLNIDIDVPINSIRLNGITTSTQTVEINVKTENRNDIKGEFNTSFALDEIILKDKNDVINKKFRLYTSYFEANDADKYQGPDPSNIYSHLNFRLRLDSVQELSGNGSLSTPPYTFVYYGDDDPATNDPYTLPYRLAPSQDHWGYFNDSGNTHIFPGNSNGITINPHPLHTLFQWYCSTNISNVFPNGANRESNAEAIKACNLNRIVYPTGGSTTFNFEANKYGNNICGGLRINQIVSNDGTQDSKVIDYTYSGGILVNEFWNDYYSLFCLNEALQAPPHILEKMGLSNFSYGSGPTSKYVLIRAFPQAVLNGTGGGVIGYTSVTERESGNGHIVYIYSNNSQKPDIHNTDLLCQLIDGEFVCYDDLFRTQYVRVNNVNGIEYPPNDFSVSLSTNLWPFPKAVDFGWMRDKLTSKLIYSELNTLLQREEIDYHYQVNSFTSGFKVIQFSITFQEYLVMKYIIPSNWSSQKSRKITTYNETGSFETKFEYDYLSNHHKQITEELQVDVHGKTSKTNYFYPQDYNPIENYATLIGKNIINIPVKVSRSFDGDFINGIITKYSNEGQSEEIYKYESEVVQGVPIHDPATLLDSDYQKRLNIVYDAATQNVREVLANNGLVTSYLWGYKNTLPIAKVTNAENGKSIIHHGEDIENVPTSYNYTQTGGAGQTYIGVIEVGQTQNIGISYTFTKETLNDPASYVMSFSIGNYNSTQVTLPTNQNEVTGTRFINNVPPGTYDFGITKDYETEVTGSVSYVKTIVTPTETVERTAEIFHDSFEEHSLRKSDIRAHTGRYYIEGTYEVNLQDKIIGDYHLSYWTNSGTEWVYNEQIISITENSSSHQIGVAGLKLDEVRLHPGDAYMTTYTYDPLVGMTSQSDPNGLTTYYEYDELNRLKLIRDDKDNIIQHYEYHYHNESQGGAQ